MSNPHGRATVSSSPNPWGICDRCGFLYNLSDLKSQYDYRGASLADTGLKVCPTCMDAPFSPNKTIRIPPDPVPVKDAKVSLALVDATVQIINGIPTAVGGSVVPTSEIED